MAAPTACGISARNFSRRSTQPLPVDAPFPSPACVDAAGPTASALKLSRTESRSRDAGRWPETQTSATYPTGRSERARCRLSRRDQTQCSDYTKSCDCIEPAAPAGSAQDYAQRDDRRSHQAPVVEPAITETADQRGTTGGERCSPGPSQQERRGLRRRTGGGKCRRGQPKRSGRPGQCAYRVATGGGGVLMKFLRTLYQMVAGRSLLKVEARANDGRTKLGLTLKQETRHGDYFVVLSITSTGEREYIHLTTSEFSLFAAQVKSIEDECLNIERNTAPPNRA